VAQLLFTCAAVVNGCESRLELSAPRGFRLPDYLGQEGSPGYVARLDWYLVHELDPRVVAELRARGWRLAYGRWVCGEH